MIVMSTATDYASEHFEWKLTLFSRFIKFVEIVNFTSSRMPILRKHFAIFRIWSKEFCIWDGTLQFWFFCLLANLTNFGREI